MSDSRHRRIRVLHLVSAAGIAGTVRSALFMPLLTRLPRERIEAQVVCLSAGLIPEAVLRPSGVAVHEIELSRRRPSLRSLRQVRRIARDWRPDLIQAWGGTAQLLSAWLRKRGEAEPALLWSVANTAPLARGAGLIERHKLKLLARAAAGVDCIVYASEAGAAQHRLCGWPEEGYLVIPPGVDAARFKPDPDARSRLRQQFKVTPDDFVIGMVAPFQPECDHASFLKAISELLQSNPHLTVLLAGQDMHKGNAALSALLKAGALSSHVRLLGEWPDLASLFNACDLACASALNDQGAVMLAMAMLCGVPCVATGLGAQGEVIGRHGVVIEPGSAAALVKGINRVLLLPADKRTAMAHGARKHALKHFVMVRSLQRYLELYYELAGLQMPSAQQTPTRQTGAAQDRLTQPREEFAPAPRDPRRVIAPITPVTPAIEELIDPDSLETRVSEVAEPLPKWRIEQEEQRARHEQELSRQLAAADPAADILQRFEAQIATSAPVAPSPLEERARGIAEEIEELLPAELLAAPADVSPSAAALESAETGTVQHDLLLQPPADERATVTLHERTARH